MWCRKMTTRSKKGKERDPDVDEAFVDDSSSVTANLDGVASGLKNYGDLSSMTVSQSSAPRLDLVRDDARQRGLHERDEFCFILELIYSSDFHEGRQYFMLMLVLNFAF